MNKKLKGAFFSLIYILLPSSIVLYSGLAEGGGDWKVRCQAPENWTVLRPTDCFGDGAICTASATCQEPDATYTCTIQTDGKNNTYANTITYVPAGGQWQGLNPSFQNVNSRIDEPGAIASLCATYPPKPEIFQTKCAWADGWTVGGGYATCAPSTNGPSYSCRYSDNDAGIIKLYVVGTTASYLCGKGLYLRAAQCADCFWRHVSLSPNTTPQ